MPATKRTRRKSPGNRAARIQQERQWAKESYERAQGKGSVFNDSLVIAGFVARGLDEEDVRPRENVLSFHAWKHVGRSVIKGERGVKVPVIRGLEVENDKGERETKTVRGMAAVFHICQTKHIGDPDPDMGSGLESVELAQIVMDQMIADEKERRAQERGLTTKAGVARGVVEAADASGVRPGGGELDDMDVQGLDNDIEGVSFAFAGDTLPAEIVEALQGQPVSVRSWFTCNAAPGMGGGEDTLAERGADWMVERAREQVLRSADSVADRVRYASADARGEMLVVLHDLRGNTPACDLPPIDLIREARLIEGAYFEIAGESFAVYERDGALRAGNGSRSFNLDSVEEVPVDRGTYDPDAKVAPESLATPLPF